jgi:transposase
VLSSLNLGYIHRFLKSLYHKNIVSMKPYNPVSMLKAQLLKYLRRVPSDRRLALLLKGTEQ